MSNSQFLNLFSLLLVAVFATGCEAIASIFEAGMWFGIIIVVVILGLVGLLVGRARR